MAHDPRLDDIDHRLHDVVVEIVRASGAHDYAWLARRARRELRDARIDEDAVRRVVWCSTLLVPRPDGRVTYALALMEGSVFTQRARAPLAGRSDLWVGTGVQPLLNATTYGPIPLADGSGEVRRAEDHDVLLGPPGWLPEVDRYALVGLRIVDQRLRLEAVAADDLPSPERELEVRETLATIYREELHRWGDVLDRDPDPAELARTVNIALLQQPDLFRAPLPPLDELLHNPLGRGLDLGHWRSHALRTQIETVSFWLEGLPVALSLEMQARARRYGMGESQFIVALLSTLAWRTPFAEDMEPWESWDPERAPLAAVPWSGD